MNPDRVKTKTYKIGIYCFSAKHAAFKENEQRLVGLGIRKMCQNEATPLPADCLSELAL
jgi:hypothetical protein